MPRSAFQQVLSALCLVVCVYLVVGMFTQGGVPSARSQFIHMPVLYT